jgi:hypothetical protein
MPVANYGAFFHQLWCRSLEPDENINDGQEPDRHQRVRRDAKRAMIGVAGDRMPNGRMCHRHEQEQDQAHPERQPQRTELQVAIVSALCPVCNQGILLGKIVPKIGRLERHASLMRHSDSAGQAGRK